MAESGSLTVYPSDFDTVKGVWSSVSDETEAVGMSSYNSDDYTQIRLLQGAGAITYVRWPFDCSGIPAGATIDSVACKAAVYFTDVSPSHTNVRTVQLCSGSATKGLATTIDSTNRKVYTLSCGAWTRDELQSCNLYFYAVRGEFNVATSISIRFYGADLTVTYTYQSEQFMLKQGGAWEGASRVFKKVSGIWVEQSELANVIEDGVRYQNGGEIKSTGPTLISFTIDGIGYQAEEGMTWIEFCSSSYNTKGFWCDDYDVMNEYSLFLYLSSSREGVRPSDTIVSGGSYYLE